MSIAGGFFGGGGAGQRKEEDDTKAGGQTAPPEPWESIGVDLESGVLVLPGGTGQAADPPEHDAAADADPDEDEGSQED